jgi:hypothetical protein
MPDRRRRRSPAAYSDTVHGRARVRREPEYKSPRRRKRYRRRAAVVKASAAARFLITRSQVRMPDLLRAKASVPAAQVATEKLVAHAPMACNEAVTRVLQ